MIIQMLENEYWYGGCVSDGTRMPVGPRIAQKNHITFEKGIPVVFEFQNEY